MNELTITENISPVSVPRKPRKKAPSRGGARKGSGRPKGVSNKIKPEDLISDFARQSGMTFEQFLNRRIIEALQMNNQDLVARYVLGMAKYYLKDIQQIDITTGGERLLVPNFIFTQAELPT